MSTTAATTRLDRKDRRIRNATRGDRAVLLALFELAEVKVFEYPGSIVAGERRYFFRPDGSVSRIIDYRDGMTYTASSAGRTHE